MEFNELIIIMFLVAFLSNIILTIITGNRPQFRLAVVLMTIWLGLTWQSWLI